MSADSRRERVVIINSNGRHLPSGQFALLTQAYPHLVTLTRAALQPEPLRTSDRDDLLLSRARVANQVALIPDLDMIEAEIARALSPASVRSEEHTSELQSLMRISYAVFRFKKKPEFYINGGDYNRQSVRL